MSTIRYELRALNLLSGSWFAESFSDRRTAELAGFALPLRQYTNVSVREIRVSPELGKCYESTDGGEDE